MPIRVALFKTLLLSLLLFPLSSNANPHFPAQQTFGGHTQTLNGKAIATVTGADFAQGLLSIWIGAKPVQASLKHGLLGQTDEGEY